MSLPCPVDYYLSIVTGGTAITATPAQFGIYRSPSHGFWLAEYPFTRVTFRFFPVKQMFYYSAHKYLLTMFTGKKHSR